MGRPKGSKNKTKTTNANDLIHLAQNLINYCSANNPNEESLNLELKLPKSIITHISKIAQPKEKIKLFDGFDDIENPTISKFYLIGGTVSLSSINTEIKGE